MRKGALNNLKAGVGMSAFVRADTGMTCWYTHDSGSQAASIPFPKTHNIYKDLLHRYSRSIKDKLVNTEESDACSAVRAGSALPFKGMPSIGAPNVDNGLHQMSINVTEIFSYCYFM